MKSLSLDRLLPMAQALYDAEFAAIRDVLDAEAHCRSGLARLDELAQSTREQSMRPGAMVILGADVLYQSHLAANRAQLNSDLAHILVRKELALGKLRKAFGRKQAIEVTLETQTRLAQREKKTKDQADALELWLGQNLDWNG